MSPRTARRFRGCLLAALPLLVVSACFAPIVSIDTRSALEQQLTSAALHRGVAKLDLRPLEREPVYRLELAVPAGSDEALIRARLEERLASEGVRLRRGDDATAAPTLRATVPFNGVDVEATLLGLPFVVPGLPVALGDISIYRSSQLTGRARIELSVRDERDLARVFSAASEASRYYRNFTFFMFIGPFRWTNLDEARPGDEEGTFWSFSGDPDPDDSD